MIIRFSVKSRILSETAGMGSANCEFISLLPGKKRAHDLTQPDTFDYSPEK
jgi:hypothetical protein